MENFDDLQMLWNRQAGSKASTSAADLIGRAEANMKALRMGQLLTIAILATLTAILIAYFIWVGAHRLNAITVGLGVMIGVILIRIVLEWISVNKLKAIKPDCAMIDFGSRMTKFYRWRRKIHLLFVPAIYISYTAGFVLLLPAFKENLSRGLYLYILVSGFVSLVVLAFFIARQIRKEIRILNLMRTI